jgi:hypothetical protein
MEFSCAHCGITADKRSGEINRARAQGRKLFCSRICFGLDRRTGKTIEERKAEKAVYDKGYRLRDPEGLKARKHDYYKRTRDPVKEAQIRKERMPLHVEYCRRPEYVAWKKHYDRKYRAEKFYGELAECFLLVMDIRDECLSRMTDYEIRLEKGTLNKSTRRKRDYERSISNGLENGSLGNLERGERGQNGGLASGLRRLPSSGNSQDYEYSAQDCSAGEEASSGRRN